MSTESKRVEGIAEKIGGAIERKVGDLVGDERMEAKGAIKEAKGEWHVESAKAQERAKGKIDETIGAMKNRVGDVVDSDKLAAEGKAQELKGEATQKVAGDKG